MGQVDLHGFDLTGFSNALALQVYAYHSGPRDSAADPWTPGCHSGQPAPFSEDRETQGTVAPTEQGTARSRTPADP